MNFGAGYEVIVLRKRVAELERENAELKLKSEIYWEALESVACGEKLFCDKCKKNHPCHCDGEEQK